MITMNDPLSHKALVIGYGSIGKRHTEVLIDLGLSVGVYSRRKIDFRNSFSSLEDALSTWQPSYVVIANETSEHISTVEELVKEGFKGILLIEKPLSGAAVPFPENNFSKIGIGYNMRFHPIVGALQKWLQNNRIYTVDITVGQWLPSWRPNTKYSESYSADPQRGGGVLRDLSHELDLLLWLFGKPLSLFALGGKVSHLNIKSDDAWSILADLERCPIASVHIDYLHKPGKRQVCVNGEGGTATIDFINGTFCVNGAVTSFPIERNDTYKLMHQAFLSSDNAITSTLQDAQNVCILIEKIEAFKGKVVD